MLCKETFIRAPFRLAGQCFTAREYVLLAFSNELRRSASENVIIRLGRSCSNVAMHGIYPTYRVFTGSNRKGWTGERRLFRSPHPSGWGRLSSILATDCPIFLHPGSSLLLSPHTWPVTLKGATARPRNVDSFAQTYRVSQTLCVPGVRRQRGGVCCYPFELRWTVSMLSDRNRRGGEPKEGRYRVMQGGTACKPVHLSLRDLTAYVFTTPRPRARKATVAERFARSPPTKANRVQSSAGSPESCTWESCRTMPLVGGFSRGDRSFRHRSISTSITLIGSDDLDPMRVKRGKNGASPECKGGGNRRTPSKPAHWRYRLFTPLSFGAIPTSENLGANPPGTELGSPRWQATILIPVKGKADLYYLDVFRSYTGLAFSSPEQTKFNTSSPREVRSTKPLMRVSELNSLRCGWLAHVISVGFLGSSSAPPGRFSYTVASVSRQNCDVRRGKWLVSRITASWSWLGGGRGGGGVVVTTPPPLQPTHGARLMNMQDAMSARNPPGFSPGELSTGHPSIAAVGRRKGEAVLSWSAAAAIGATPPPPPPRINEGIEITPGPGVSHPRSAATAHRVPHFPGSAEWTRKVPCQPDDAAGRRVFLGISRSFLPCILALLHTHLTSPSSALKTGPPKSLHSTPPCQPLAKIIIKSPWKEMPQMAAVYPQRDVKRWHIKWRSDMINRIRLERASQKQSSDTHKTPYDRVKRCRERKTNIKASERVNADLAKQRWGSVTLFTSVPCKLHITQANGTEERLYIGRYKLEKNVGTANIRTSELQADPTSSAQREPITMPYVDPRRVDWAARIVIGAVGDCEGARSAARPDAATSYLGAARPECDTGWSKLLGEAGMGGAIGYDPYKGTIPAFVWSGLGKPRETETMMAELGLEPVFSRMQVQLLTTVPTRSRPESFVEDGPWHRYWFLVHYVFRYCVRVRRPGFPASVAPVEVIQEF
ncbi:hypothetical protein PR048_024727 [Dryococelus australis]|uniref:Uncharacterized protein n=1 Tax=Dryococelus australis TaxID=614101 RepID=A0ABQ9GPG2_9NEOP|nr:hypothetical protein PR048_024727 [Dryococelus australis]